MLIIILIGFIFWALKQGIITSVKEMQETITEARMVRNDLNNIMEKSINVSREIIDSISQDMKEKESHSSKVSTVNSSRPSHEVNTSNNKKSPKIRLYELSRELGMDSHILINQLNAMGYNYNNSLNTLDKDIVTEIKRKISHTSELHDDPIFKTGSIHDKLICLDIDPQKTEMWMQSLKAAHPYLAVRTLADKGYSVKEMAQILNRGQGEITLILNLLAKKERKTV